MATFQEMANRTRSLSKKETINSMIYDILKDDFVQDWILEANKKQLSEKGEDSTGKKLQTYVGARWGIPYAPFTIADKKQFGQGIGKITDHVTLYSSGALYKSFKLVVKKLEAVFDANMDKVKGNIDIENILGLNDENMYALVWHLVYPRLLQRTKSKLLGYV